MNEFEDVRLFVASHPPFDRLPRPALTRLCSAIEVSYQPAGTELLKFGASNNELHLIRRGVVGLFDENAKLVEKRAEGEVYGYPSILTGRQMRFAVRAEEDSLIYHVPGEIFRELRAGNPEFDRFFSLALVERIEQSLRREDHATLESRSVDEIMTRPVRTVAPDEPIFRAAEMMAEHRISSVLVAESNKPIGIVTDRDLRNRIVARRRPFETPIAEVMTADPVAIRPDESAIAALLMMTDHNVHHLPVAGRDGDLLGIVSISDLLKSQNTQPVHFVGQVRRAPDAASLARTARRRMDLLVHLVENGVGAHATTRVLTTVADAATKRLIELSQAELGPPPMGFAWVCFGSQARREQAGRTDQDNGIILAETPDESVLQYFAAMARFVCDGLHDCGFVHCPGDVMATNPRWCVSLEEWRGHFSRWIDEPEPKALMYASIFFDLRSVAGDEFLVRQLRDHIFARTSRNQIFLRFMAQNALQHRPPLGLFRQFILEEDGDHGEGLNLKKRGVVPITGLARIRALESGFDQPGTRERLLGVGASSGSSNADLESLADAFELIGRCRLEHQVRQIRLSSEPDNLLELSELSPLLRRNLKAAFRVVRTAQQSLAQKYLLD